MATKTHWQAMHDAARPLAPTDETALAMRKAKTGSHKDTTWGCNVQSDCFRPSTGHFFSTAGGRRGGEATSTGRAPGGRLGSRGRFDSRREGREDGPECVGGQDGEGGVALVLRLVLEAQEHAQLLEPLKLVVTCNELSH